MNYLNHIKFSLFLLLISSYVYPLYVEFTPAKDLVNTDDLGHYVLFKEALKYVQPDITEARETQLQIELGELGVLEPILQNSVALIEYGNILSELKKLPAGSGCVLIDSNWVLGAKHVFEAQVGNAVDTATGAFIGRLIEVFPHPTVPDLALGRLEAYCTSMTPVKRYLSPSPAGKSFYAYSGTMHNAQGSIVAPITETDREVPLFGTCHAVGEVIPGQPIYTLTFDTTGPIKVASYGGDSGSPLFVKISETGHPIVDYQVAGVHNPAGASLQVMWTANKEVDAWINSVIINQALR